MSLLELERLLFDSHTVAAIELARRETEELDLRLRLRLKIRMEFDVDLPERFLAMGNRSQEIAWLLTYLQICLQIASVSTWPREFPSPELSLEDLECELAKVHGRHSDYFSPDCS